MKKLTVLVGCEESQAITKAFRELGHDAYSCDLLPTSGENPEWHIQGDVFDAIASRKWDLGIFHPPCTFLAVSGARWMYNDDGSVNQERLKNQNEALDFVQRLMDADIPSIVVENPISVISSKIRKPDQIVQPYWFGDSATKSTCLWIKNLPMLTPTNMVSKGTYKEWTDKNGKKKRQSQWYYDAFCSARTPAERRTLRSKTFKGMAEAMALQWGGDAR